MNKQAVNITFLLHLSPKRPQASRQSSCLHAERYVAYGDRYNLSGLPHRCATSNDGG